ncbi:MAG: glycosyltransferase [Alistipes sp.]
MNKLPMVSVCMITYNHAPYIRQAIEGVLMQQTSFPIELIIGEDCGTDATRAIVKEYETQRPDLIVGQYPEHNRGMMNNFMTVLSASQGKYIALCEGDDYWTDPLKLQKQVDFLEAHPDYGMCYTNFDIYNQKKNKFRRALFTTEPTRFPHNYVSLEAWIASKGYVAPMTWLFKRDLLKDVNLKNAVDGSFILFAQFLHHTKVHCLMDVTAVYRELVVSASHTNDLQKRYNRRYGLLMAQLSMIKQYGLPQKLAEEISVKYYRHSLKDLVALNQQKEIESAKRVLKNRLHFIHKILLSINKTALTRNSFRVLSNVYIHFQYR